MARTFDYDLSTGTLNPSAFHGPGSRGETFARIDRLARVLDSAFVVPGTSIRFGFDALIGIVPGIGDAITTALSAYIVYEAHRLGAPKHMILRMIANVAFDTMITAIPVAGNIADVFFRANRKNIALLRGWLERHGGI
jgi:C4-dicarboxylate transporter